MFINYLISPAGSVTKIVQYSLSSSLECVGVCVEAGSRRMSLPVLLNVEMFSQQPEL